MRALLVGLFALALASQVAAAATTANATTVAKPSARVAKTKQKPVSLERSLERSRGIADRHRATIQYYEKHPRLLVDDAHRERANVRLRDARRGLAKARASIARLGGAIAARDAHRLAAMPPRQAICNVFGEYCGQAVGVAWCESRLQVTASNGQYLGLFQMGSNERRLFGHGPTAHEQAVAAHKYFVRSGRDWSPWSCRWAAS